MLFGEEHMPALAAYLYSFNISLYVYFITHFCDDRLCGSVGGLPGIWKVYQDA
jgi:hypothetical protein